MSYEKGQQLWCVTSGLGKDRFVTIESVGRKWLHLSDDSGWWSGKADKHTLIIDADGYSPTDKCYLSRQHQEQEHALELAWENFRKLVAGSQYAPERSTISMINSISRELFAEIGE